VRKLKILMIAPTPYFADRGCHVRIYEEARALLARGHQVVIVAYHLGRDVGNIPVHRIPRIPWYKKLSAGPSWHKPFLDLLLLWKVISVFRTFRPDVIHAHLHEGAFIAALSKPFCRVPVLFDCQGSLSGELLDHGFMKQRSLLHRAFSALEGWITRRADHIVTSSTPTADAIRRDFPGVIDILTPLPDAVDTEMFQPLPKEVALQRALGLPEDKKLIVYLGAMTTYQGVDLLLNALQQLAAERDDFHALLMGYPEEAYVVEAEGKGLYGRVTFTGKVDYAEASRYLSLGDVAVSPKLSATEANGKLLNYLACGLPIVATDNRVNRELLGDAAVYMRTADAAELSGCLSRLLDGDAQRGALAVAARNHVLEKHSWHARIETLEDIYRSLS